MSEVERIKARGPLLQLNYRSLFALSGSAGGSRSNVYIEAVDEKVKKAITLADDASLFAGEAKSLEDATLEEIDRVQVRLSNSLATVRGVREDLEREESSVEAQSAQLREQRLRTL